jgi:quinol monooxygenase YgiN
MNKQLTVIAHVRAKPGHEARVREILMGLIAPTRAEQGCIDYDLHASNENTREFVFYENWATPEHLDIHAKSAHILAARKLMEGLLEGPIVLTKWTMISKP